MPKLTAGAQTKDLAPLVTAVRRGFIQRTSDALRYMVTGVGPDTWFGPGQPLQPQAQQAEGRQWDYPFFQNVTYTPRASEGINFQQLRALADNCDLVRLAVETRKDQLSKLRFTISNRDPDKDDKDDPRVAQILQFMRKPDGLNNWSDWLRMLIEELLVIDAPAIYIRKNLGGELFGLEVLDGSTIHPLIDGDGRRPATGAAYQQILKGMPAVSYTAEELIYAPRNRRVWKLYGCSPVEQVVMTVNIALRRQLHKLQYYTEGNIPEALISCPPDWSPQQISEMEMKFNGVMEGDTGQRRHAKFVPGGIKVDMLKEGVLKDEFDEWLARIVCYAFSLPPSAFVKSMNRATAETAQDTALEEGQLPIMQWVKNLWDGIIETQFGFDDLEFGWEQENAVDVDAQSKVHAVYLKMGVMTVNEVREDLGLDPVPNGDEPLIYTAQGAITLEEAKAPPQPPPMPEGPKPAVPGEPVQDEKKKISKRAKRRQLKPIDRKTPKITEAATTLKGALTAALGLVGESVTRQLTQALSKAAGDGSHPPKSQTQVNEAIAALELDGLVEVSDELGAVLEQMATDGAMQGLVQLGLGDDQDMLNLANERAIAWSQKHAAELIGKDADSGVLADGTRDLIRGTVTDAVSEGWSSKSLADKLADSYAFSDDRAETIARTEVAMAHVAGSMEGYRVSGVVEKKVWLVAEDPCDECEGNESDGEIDLDDTFSSGDDAPPAHPRCECDVAPIVYDDNESDEE